ncbi:Elongation factor Ts, mitochondrial [Coemansia spiralis]|uniref:Elongation factor Ts, mitochondrial n=2 Tax=Coemansia TaxID=4863 RepID=A0A9W8GA15_9FUNG|nr:elongation factor TS-domain-containing protein [Coemansia spiralis]KAJ1995437.1 Elongation factor Ts, mitochondrial [Coemansia umbellata]KAJ2624733.1 Elongation factor Ts, mitochondrial [Coemansia sp. RSA 1358]KAJ2678276.1 Elongation factor Ts, mitochondrial [Coemansia spiralis]
MLSRSRHPCLHSRFSSILRPSTVNVRAYATKVDIKALKKLRELNPVSITKAKEALINTDNDIERALEWLDKDALTSGAKKAEKVKDRTASEGAIAMHIGDDLTAAAIIELGCETDFVARNATFVDLASGIAQSAMALTSPNSSAVLANIELGLLASKMLGNRSIADTITETIGRLGENVVLRRATTIGCAGASDSIVTSGYVHGGVPGSSGGSAGKIGSLVAIRSSIRNSQHRHALNQLAKRIAQQVVGYAPRFATLKEWGEYTKTLKSDAADENPEAMVLEMQPFLFGGGTVGEVLAKVSKEIDAPVEIASFVRYERGEGIEKPVKPSFAEEVRQQLG